MTEADVLPASEMSESAFELATWLGRRQAFGLMASRCSAADVECLRMIRERKLYKSKAANWPEFCERYLGLSKAYANRLIQQLDEFGPNYFHISQMMRISADSYRAIAGAVREDGIEFGGDKIPISAEHSQRIVEAVNSLRKAAERAEGKPKGGRTKRERGPLWAELTPRQRIERMRKRLDRFASELSAIAREELDGPDRARLSALVGESHKRLTLLVYSLP